MEATIAGEGGVSRSARFRSPERPFNRMGSAIPCWEIASKRSERGSPWRTQPRSDVSPEEDEFVICFAIRFCRDSYY